MEERHYNYFVQALIAYVTRYEDDNENLMLLTDTLNRVNKEILLKYFSEVLYIIRHGVYDKEDVSYDCLYKFMIMHKDKLLIEDALATAAFLNKNINKFYEYYIARRYYPNESFKDQNTCEDKYNAYAKNVK